MANIKALDSDGAVVRLRSDGVGSDGDPYIFKHRTELVARSLVDTPSALTDPGSTGGFDVSTYDKVGAYYLVASIDTDVTVNIEISPDNTNWVKVGADVVQTANGFYTFPTILEPCTHVRGNFVAETGGTNAEVTFTFLAKS